MGKILCPTRGGEQSYQTQDAAISLALEQERELVFLYVVNVHFLDHTPRAVRPDVVEEEMARMGEFLLAIAQERAREKGLEAGTLIRRGEFKDELIVAVQDEEADLVVLGHPGGEKSAFLLAGLEELAATVTEETGVEVRIL